MNGSHVLDANEGGRHDGIREYWKGDLRVADRIYQRLCDLNIGDISKYSGGFGVITCYRWCLEIYQALLHTEYRVGCTMLRT